MTTIADLRALAETDLGVELARIEAGEPIAIVSIAGLQYHSYHRRDELGIVRPYPGDRLSLVREPENPHDGNAVQVWWRNSHMIGHLPWAVAGRVAPGMDAGEPLRAYVLDGGNGCAWSVTALLAGPLVERVKAAA